MEKNFPFDDTKKKIQLKKYFSAKIKIQDGG